MEDTTSTIEEQEDVTVTQMIVVATSTVVAGYLSYKVTKTILEYRSAKKMDKINSLYFND